MTMKKIAAVAAHSMFHSHSSGGMMMRGPTITRDPNDDSGHNADEAARAAAEAEAARVAAEAEAEAARAAAEGGKTDDEKARLLKDVMKWKEKAREQEAKAKLYDGIDPEKARVALAAQAEAERKELEARGEYQRIIEQVSTEANNKVAAAEAQVAAVSAQLAELQRTIESKDIAAKFANSAFVRENLVISGSKVQTLYGDHFDIVDGEQIAYDKPRGEKDRTPLVDEKGKNLSFEAALEKIIKADSDFEKLAKSNLKKGAGSNSSNLNPNVNDKPETSRDMIAKGLGSLKRTTLLGNR